MRWAAIVGSSGDGRDAVLDALLVAWRGAGLAVAGFRHVGGSARDDRGKALDLLLEDLSSGARVPLASSVAKEGDICCFHFQPQAFEAAARWCDRPKADVLVLSSLGALEAAGQGHAGLLRRLAASARPALHVLCIRRDSLAALALGLPDPMAGLELPARSDEVAAFADSVGRAVGRPL